MICALDSNEICGRCKYSLSGNYLIFMCVIGWLGFRWDRNWLIVNSKGRGLTQRVEPKLSLIEVEMPKHAFAQDWEPDNNSNMGKILSFYSSTEFLRYSFFFLISVWGCVLQWLELLAWMYLWFH